ncbi:hypothetical protein GXM_05452 [Nostoc sphaeroides CCNUC1]|uniref:Uncharacterized protein n=1 Tax=Nostoc sphaeroides CCNUC1 TaxID=2653204 RepID=A0A5P8W5M7_9NOSO|nr:hypothetical protein GXM_05452 [Nostoc sphaeroides CCNUC1]
MGLLFDLAKAVIPKVLLIQVGIAGDKCASTQIVMLLRLDD